MKIGAFVVVLIVASRAATAQSINGNADWGYSRSTFRTADDTTENGSFTQGYTFGYASSLWDPRFALYSGEVTFNRNALTFDQNASGSQQTGFNAAASLFSMRPFRLSLRATRSVGDESANYPETALVRSGLSLAAGSTPELRTSRSSYGASWVLSAPSMPRVEFSYDQAAATVAAGPLDATQDERSIQALVSHDSTHVSNTVRYQSHASNNDVSTAFQQRYSEIGYELGLKADDRTRADVRIGRRDTASRFAAPPDLSGDDLYRPPVNGDVELYYATATVTHRPSPRFATDASVGFNSEASAGAGTGALLASTTARVLPFSGLTLRATGTYGERRQDLAGARATELTRALGAGVDYQVRVRAFHGLAGYDVEHGWNTSGLHVNGESRAWRARVDTGVDLFGVVQLGVGHDRDRSVDQLLSLGNQLQDRTHASARSMIASRVLVDATFEHAVLDRGVLAQMFRTRYSQATTSVTVPLVRDRRVGVTAGRFLNESFAANERNQYAGLTFSGPIVGQLRLSMTARREHATSQISHLDQNGYYTMGTLEYRLRLFTFSLEHRYTDLALTTSQQLGPLTFVGNQIVFRVGRKFGMAR